MDTTFIQKKRSDLHDVLTQIDTLATTDEPNLDDIAALQKRADGMKSQIEALTNSMAARAASADLDVVLARADRAAEQKREELIGSDMTPGELFTRSAEFTRYGGYGTSGRVDVPHQRAVSLPMKTTDFPSGLVAGSRYLTPAGLLAPLLDLIPTVVTSLNSFPVWGTTVAADAGGAAVVPEGDAKPALEISEAKIDVSLDMVAVYTQITRQALEDIPMMRSIIDTTLTRAVLKKFEELAVTAITSAGLPTAQAPNSGGTLQGAIRLGIAKVQTAGWNPNAVAVNPDDAANVDIAALQLASGCCADNFWNLRVVPVPGLTAGTAIVGDFSNGATTYQRQAGVSVFITDSHSDTFLHNVFTILAETRRKTVVERADAFAKVSVAGP